LEIAVAVLGIATTLAWGDAAALFVTLEAQLGLFAWALPFTLVSLPAFVMGGTFPVLVKSLAPQAGQISVAGGRLYAANTASAIAGALLTSFLLIPLLGVRSTAFAAAAINLAAAIGALGLDHAVELRATGNPSLQPIRLAAEARVALCLYAVAGGIALGYEVVWSQAIV
jgi:predicted membrane-bound spermidine synthase